MDPRRFVILAAAGLMASGCAILRPAPVWEPPQALPPVAMQGIAVDQAAPLPAPLPAPVEVEEGEAALRAVPDTVEATPVGRPYLSMPDAPGAGVAGRAAIRDANARARASSRPDGFVGGMQVFAWAPGRVFEVWAAPLRVTTLTLSPGEVVIARAAGDTVRWQIGEATSGSGETARTHVLLKPLERGLQTNLILTTNKRIYLIDLMSGAAETFNAAVAWDSPEDAPPPGSGLEAGRGPDLAPVRVPDPVAMPQGELDARYRIEARGRRPAWTPTAVFNDGQRTFITFAPELQTAEAPVLFAIAADGEAQMVNYRQAGGLFVIDRVLVRAELRLGDRRPQIVRIHHLDGARP